jgi:hypothetical protein
MLAGIETSVVESPTTTIVVGDAAAAHAAYPPIDESVAMHVQDRPGQTGTDALRASPISMANSR